MALGSGRKSSFKTFLVSTEKGSNKANQAVTHHQLITDFTFIHAFSMELISRMELLSNLVGVYPFLFFLIH
jgi:hypothetical protein